MNMQSRPTLNCLLIAAATLLALPAAAVPTTLTYAGVLKDGHVPFNGTVDVTFTLFDASQAGAEQYSEELNGLVVLDGALVAELGQNALDDATLELPELWLEVTVNGEVLVPRVRLNSVPYALRAEAAARAEEALTLGGLLATDVVTQDQLATLGLSAGVSTGAGLASSGGTLSIASGGVVSSMLAPGSVGTAQLADASVTGAKIANGAITTAKVSGARTLYRIDDIACDDVGQVSLTAACFRRSCGGGEFVACGTTNTCSPDGAFNNLPICINTRLGALLP